MFTPLTNIIIHIELSSTCCCEVKIAALVTCRVERSPQYYTYFLIPSFQFCLFSVATSPSHSFLSFMILSLSPSLVPPSPFLLPLSLLYSLSLPLPPLFFLLLTTRLLPLLPSFSPSISTLMGHLTLTTNVSKHYNNYGAILSHSSTPSFPSPPSLNNRPLLIANKTDHYRYHVPLSSISSPLDPMLPSFLSLYRHLQSYM